MRLAPCLHRGAAHLGVLRDNRVLLPSVPAGWPNDQDSLQTLIQSGIWTLTRLAKMARQSSPESWLSLDRVTLLAPLPHPQRNLICLGWNYAEHLQESASVAKREIKIPEDPVVFTKAPSA